MSERIIERCLIDIKVDEGHVYIEMFPAFRQMLMAAPGAVATRLLRNRAKPDSFLCEMEFESQGSKDLFIADPRLKPWATEFFTHVADEIINYYDEVG